MVLKMGSKVKVRGQERQGTVCGWTRYAQASSEVGEKRRYVITLEDGTDEVFEEADLEPAPDKAE